METIYPRVINSQWLQYIVALYKEGFLIGIANALRLGMNLFSLYCQHDSWLVSLHTLSLDRSRANRVESNGLVISSAS